MTDIVMVSVLQTEVVLLQDVHLIVDLLQKLLSGGLLLNTANLSSVISVRICILGAW